MPRIFCYITDRTQFPGDGPERRRRLLAKIREASQYGLDYIQLREKDLPARDLEDLAGEVMRILRDTKLRTENRELRTALLINSRADVALAVGADGVHLPSNDISPLEARRILWAASVRITISVSCHEPSEVKQAETAGADLALFAPVFEKRDLAGLKPTGIDALREACQHPIPVLALGGITLENAAACLDVGAAGIAGIRLFQENDIGSVLRKLRDL